MQGLYARFTRWVHQNRAHFSKMIDLRDHMPRCTVRRNIFPSISLVTPSMCVDGSHAKVYSDMHVFPSISLDTLQMCVETLRTWLIVPR